MNKDSLYERIGRVIIDRCIVQYTGQPVWEDLLAIQAEQYDFQYPFDNCNGDELADYIESMTDQIFKEIKETNHE